MARNGLMLALVLAVELFGSGYIRSSFRVSALLDAWIDVVGMERPS